MMRATGFVTTQATYGLNKAIGTEVGVVRDTSQKVPIEEIRKHPSAEEPLKKFWTICPFRVN